jgi:hypothetical protein
MARKHDVSPHILPLQVEELVGPPNEDELAMEL